MKNKKSIIAIIAVLLIAVVGVTFAYFQSTSTFENLFATGTYRVVTTEVFESPDNWAPGQEIPKTITSTNEGTIPAAVRASITEQWLKEIDGVETDITNQVENGTVIINFANTNDWTHVGNYYYYNYILNPNETTTSFIESVTLNPNINGAACVASQDGLTQICEATNLALGATYKLIITKETVQADKYQDVWNTNVEINEKPDNTVTILSGTKGNLQPGDTVGIGETEDFFVVSSDNSENGKTVLLAKYNLLVGDVYQNYEVIRHLDYSVNGYGLQSVDAVGYFHEYEESIGGVEFSSTNYWMDENTLKSKYTENDSIYYYNWYMRYRNDNSVAHPYIYDENCLIYPYISGENGYVNKLISMGAPSTITGRLLSYEEANNIIDIEIDGQKIANIANQKYWIGSTEELYYADLIDEYYLSGWNINYPYAGVRPVIEIKTSDIG